MTSKARKEVKERRKKEEEGKRRYPKTEEVGSRPRRKKEMKEDV